MCYRIWACYLSSYTVLAACIKTPQKGERGNLVGGGICRGGDNLPREAQVKVERRACETAAVVVVVVVGKRGLR